MLPKHFSFSLNFNGGSNFDLLCNKFSSKVLWFWFQKHKYKEEGTKPETVGICDGKCLKADFKKRIVWFLGWNKYIFGIFAIVFKTLNVDSFYCIYIFFSVFKNVCSFDVIFYCLEKCYQNNLYFSLNLLFAFSPLEGRTVSLILIATFFQFINEMYKENKNREIVGIFDGRSFSFG